MPSVLECAELCDAVYSSNPTLAGWALLPGGFKATGSGLSEAFQGAAFKKGDEVVFAFKGTTPTMARDIVADIKLGVGMNTSHYGEAGDFVDDTVIPEGCKVYLTGHSLGGAIAQTLGNRQRLPFVTFNAPGVGLMSRNLDQMAQTVATGTAKIRVLGTIASAFLHPIQAAQDLMALGTTVRGVNLRLAKDVVSLVGVHFGDVKTVPAGGVDVSVTDAHFMKTFLKVIRESDYWNSIRVESLI